MKSYVDSLDYHYNDVIMSAMASQNTSLTIVYSTVYSGADQRKHQSSASLAFVRGIHRWPVNSPHKGPVTRKMFQFDDVIMMYVTVAADEYLKWIKIYIKFNIANIIERYICVYIFEFHAQRTWNKWFHFVNNVSICSAYSKRLLVTNTWVDKVWVTAFKKRLWFAGFVFCLLLRVSPVCARPITGQVTSVTWYVIGWSKSELTLSKRQKTGPDFDSRCSLSQFIGCL